MSLAKTTIMTTLARLAILLLLSLFASSCQFDINFGSAGKAGNGNVVSETRNIPEDFTMIKATEGIDVLVTQATDFKIEIEGDANIIDLIGTKVKDGKLTVYAKENIGRATKKVYVSLPKITGLSSTSGADLTVQGKITASTIDLDASSGADLLVELEAFEVFANCSSGADIEIIGKADMLHADASSGSDIKARDLVTQKCNAEASSGSDIAVHVTEYLVADASSGGDISYGGNPNVEKRKSSSGSVSQY